MSLAKSPVEPPSGHPFMSDTWPEASDQVSDFLDSSLDVGQNAAL